MSVQTTADQLKDNAKECIIKAIKDLSEALEYDTWGSQDFSEKYTETIEESILELHRIKRKL